MAKDVKITSKGIQKILKNYNPKFSFSEYVWNGFDAGATEINIEYKANTVGYIEEITIKDNGKGIDLNKLKEKFDPFYDSQKAIEIKSPKHTSLLHGKNGVGRLTFFTFCSEVKWVTTFKGEKEKLHGGSISIGAGTLNKYTPNKSLKPQPDTGTEVIFNTITITEATIENDIIPFLEREFCWFLELNKPNGYSIKINNTPLDYTDLISDYEDDIELKFDSNTSFNVKYVQWKKSLNKEFSKFYFLNEKDIEIYKDYTSLNKKGDKFYHSIFISSSYFNEFDFKSSENDGQVKLFQKAKSSDEYKFLIEKLNSYLKNKRKPFLREFAGEMVEEYQKNGVFPEFVNEWDKLREKQLKETIIGLYEVQPKLFNNLNLEQRKTFVRFLDLLLDSTEHDRIFKILDEIIELESDERQELADLFKVTSLSKIVKTIKLIQDRYETYYKLKDLVFNPDLKANEVDHLQKLIEKHYWIFGEQYHLVTAAEPKFNEALRRYVFHLTKDDTSSDIQHPHKLKEMDIFACRQNILNDRIENIVVELKHPEIKLGSNQYQQVYNYLDVILKQSEFNAPNMYWEFYLIGNKFDSTDFIQNLINTNKPHGNQSLIQNLKEGRVKIYAKKWSEIFADFEIKHKYLDEKLQLERDKLINELDSAQEVVDSVSSNSAVQPKEVEIKK